MAQESIKHAWLESDRNLQAQRTETFMDQMETYFMVAGLGENNCEEGFAEYITDQFGTKKRDYQRVNDIVYRFMELKEAQAKKIIADAKAEADKIINDAKAEAAQILENANSQASEIIEGANIRNTQSKGRPKTRKR